MSHLSTSSNTILPNSSLFPIHFIHFQPELSILDAVILELTGCKNDKIAIQQLEKVQNATGKLLEKVQKV